MHNQPTIRPICSPAVALPAQNVRIIIPEADADGEAAFRAAVPVADGAVSPKSPTGKAVRLPIKIYELLSSAAKDVNARVYISKNLEH